VFAGLKEVSREAMEDVGEARALIFDLVARNLLLMRCGTWSGIDGSEKASANREVELSPAWEKLVAMVVPGGGILGWWSQREVGQCVGGRSRSRVVWSRRIGFLVVVEVVVRSGWQRDDDDEMYCTLSRDTLLTSVQVFANPQRLFTENGG
jgi:hypothetical protein